MKKIFKVLVVLTLIFGFSGISFTDDITSPTYREENRIYVQPSPYREPPEVIPYHNSDSEPHIMNPSPYMNREAPDYSDVYQNPRRVPDNPFLNAQRYDNETYNQSLDNLYRYLNRSRERKSIDDPEW